MSQKCLFLILFVSEMSIFNLACLRNVYFQSCLSQKCLFPILFVSDMSISNLVCIFLNFRNCREKNLINYAVTKKLGILNFCVLFCGTVVLVKLWNRKTIIRFNCTAIHIKHNICVQINFIIMWFSISYQNYLLENNNK